MVWKNYAVYEGSVHKGIFHGYGTYVKPNGIVYMGDWSNGKRSGYGKLSYEKHYKTTNQLLDEISKEND